MNRDDLEALREGWDFEAKLAAGRDGQGALPESLWETYSAMANTEGGVIVLGARERDDGSLELRGIPDIDKVERDLWNALENPQKVSANILRREDVKRVELEGHALLVIGVPKASRSRRPVHLNGSWERKTFLRVHEGDRVADREVARRMLADSIPNRDAEAAKEFSRADLHAESVGRYREFFAAKRQGHPFLGQDDDEFLLSVGALVRGRSGREPRPSLAGLLMLGKELAIRELLPHWHLSYREPPDTPEDPRRWVDRLHPDGTWNANLFQFYLRAILKLHEGLKVPFALEGGQFRVDETPVHQAVREALINTLIHADYQGTAGVRIIRSRSRFELVNPGLLLVTPEQVWRGGISEARNPALQRLFVVLQLGEREGSGGPTMRRVWRDQHWRAPTLWEDVEHGEVHLELRQESLLPEEAVASLAARWGEAFRTLDELGRVTLVTAAVEGSISHARIREISDAHPRDITLKLQELVRRGFLESSGRRRGTTYALPVPASSTQSPASSTQSSTQTAPSSTQSTGEQGVAASSWASREEVEAAILAIAAPGFVTADELARRLKRSIRTLRQNYLNRMVADGKLTLLHPDKPTSPHQAYRAARRGG